MYDQEDAMDLVEISAEKVRAYLEGVSNVGADEYGARLVSWLAEQLASRGVVTSYPEYEGEGWAVNHATRGGSEFSIQCRPDHDKGDLWKLSLRRVHNKLSSASVPLFDEASVLVSAIGEVVDDTGVGRTHLWRAF